MILEAVSIVLKPSNLHMELLNAAAKNWAKMTHGQTELAVAEMINSQKSDANPLYRACGRRGSVLDPKQVGRLAEQLALDDPVPRSRRPLLGE